MAVSLHHRSQPASYRVEELPSNRGQGTKILQVRYCRREYTILWYINMHFMTNNIKLNHVERFLSEYADNPIFGLISCWSRGIFTQHDAHKKA